MDIEILANDLDFHILLETLKKGGRLIVKFIRYNLRYNIFRNKKLLKRKRCFDYGKPHKRTCGKTKWKKRLVWFGQFGPVMAKYYLKMKKLSSKPLVYYN